MNKIFSNLTKELTDNAIKKNNEVQVVKVSCALFDKLLQNSLILNKNKDLETLITLTGIMKKVNPKKIIFYWNKHVYKIYGTYIINDCNDFIMKFNIDQVIEKHLDMFPKESKEKDIYRNIVKNMGSTTLDIIKDNLINNGDLKYAALEMKTSCEQLCKLCRDNQNILLNY